MHIDDAQRGGSMGRALILFTLPVLLGAGSKPARAADKPTDQRSDPVLVRTFPLEGVRGPADRTGIAGRIDHMRYDPLASRLFIACVANGSLEVIDLDSGTRAGTVAGLRGPQGVGVVGHFVYVSSGDDGQLHRFDARTLAAGKSVAVGDDADNVRVAPDGKIWVSFGGTGRGGISCFDGDTLVCERTLHLPRMPEGFQLDPSGPGIFANLPAGKRSADDGTVVGLNRQNGDRLWERKLIGRAGNFPMTLDSANDRLFIVARTPARLISLSARDGSILGETPCPPQSDDLFFDPRSGLVAVIGGGVLPTVSDPGGAGASLDLFVIDKSGQPSRLGGSPLPPHSRTGTLVADRQTIYVAVPARQNRPAEIREYSLPEPPPDLERVGTIALKGPVGGLDHLAFDARRGRLFVANTVNGSLDIVDVKSAKLIQQFPGQAGISGVDYSPNLDRIFVGNGTGGICNVFDGSDYRLLKNLPLGDEADNVRYEPHTRRIFVVHADHELSVIDADSYKVGAPIDLPKSLGALKVESSQPRVYVNAKAAGLVFAIDPQYGRVVGRFPVAPAAVNASLAIDEPNRRLFVGCRREPTLVVMDSDSGKIVASLPIPGDVDDLWFDAKRKRIYASCGDGAIAVIEQVDANHYKHLANVPTQKGARTSVLDATTGTLYLAVPRREERPDQANPEVWVYQTTPVASPTD